MKIEKITQNKIKITLTSDDMEIWQLDIDKLSTNAPEARRFFWNVIERAENELSFDIKDSQLLVEATVNGDGSIIHISKICQDTDEYDRINRAKIRRVEVRVRRKPNPQNKTAVFVFSCINDAANACREITANFEGCSSFYKYNEKYYLLMYFAAPFEKQLVHIMTEFGTQAENSNVIIGRINEYGESIIKDNAVYALSSI